MAKARSPVLGFNHNIRHRGWLFHVQTEDSGVSNPHIFSHLFHDGVIIATKKITYDAESDVEIVKNLMQAQHKAVLKGLKSGEYDEKIKKYLGEAPEGGEQTIATGAPEDMVDDAPTMPVPLPEAPAADQVPPQPPAPRGVEQSPRSWVVARPGQKERPFERSGAQKAITDDDVVRGRPLPPPVRPAATEPAEQPAFTPRQRAKTVPPAGVPAEVKREASAPGARRESNPPGFRRNTPVPEKIVEKRREGTGPVKRPSGEGPAAANRRPATKPPESSVVVARPAVVIGAPPTVIGGPNTATARARAPSHARELPPSQTADNIFGQDLISEKSLDEVIMAYLSEDSSDE